MIKLFPQNATKEQLKTNGIAVLDRGIKSNSVEQTRNGSFTFDFEYFSDAKFASEIKGHMIVVAPTPIGEQVFRIHTITEQIGYVKVECFHIFYDLAGNMIEDSNFIDSTGEALLNRFEDALQYPTDFNFSSDIKTKNTARIVRMNPVQALLDTSKDNSFVNRWGGDLIRDNYDIKFLEKAGEDRGFIIRHGKNLTGYDYKIDWENVATRIMPEGYNGLFLPERYIDSPLIDKYTSPIIAVLDCKEVKAIDSNSSSQQEDALPLNEAYDKLRQLAKEAFENKNADKPAINIKINFKNLGDSREYEQFKSLVEVKPFDTVHIIMKDFEIEDRVIGFKYDAVVREYTEIELGTISRTGITGKTSSTENKVNDVSKNVEETNTNLDKTNEKVSEVETDVEEVRDDLDSTAKEAQERIEKVKADVNQTQADMSKVMNAGGNNKIEWLPNLMNATQMKIHTSYGYWLLDDAGAGFHSNNGQIMNGLSADGRIYAYAITSNTLTGTNIVGGTMNGGIIDGAKFIAGSIETKSHIQVLNSAGQVSTSIASYGISTPALTVDGDIDRAVNINVQYLHVSGNISGNSSGLYVQGPVHVTGELIVNGKVIA